MKIGLIGFFGVGAYSDDLIEYATKRLLLNINPNITFDSSLLSKCARGTDPAFLNSFDLLIHCGGSLLGKCTHYPLRDIAAWVDKVETPLAVFGTGYRHEPDKEPLSPESRQRMSLLLKKAEVISLRGESSLYHCRQNGIDVSEVCSLGDPVMACDIELHKTPKYLMGNVRNMSPAEIQHSTTEKVQKLMAEIYDWLIDYYKLPLVLISFRHNVKSDNDLKGAYNVKRMMKHSNKTTSFTPNDFMEAVTYMRHAKFWFGQRLHPTIFAGVQGIPFVGVEYQFDKMIDWMSTVGVNNYIHTRDDTLESFREAFSKFPNAMQILKKTIPIKKKEIRKVAEKIMDLI